MGLRDPNRFVQSISTSVINYDQLKMLQQLTKIRQVVRMLESDEITSGVVLYYLDSSLLSYSLDLKVVELSDFLVNSGLYVYLTSRYAHHLIPIDDRSPVSSYLMGFLYGKNIPYTTYSLMGYGANIMIEGTSAGHIFNKEELREFINGVTSKDIRGKFIPLNG